MATDLKRTDSMIRPQMFQFDQHFDFEEIIGRSTMSEVCLDICASESSPCMLRNIKASRRVLWGHHWCASSAETMVARTCMQPISITVHPEP